MSLDPFDRERFRLEPKNGHADAVLQRRGFYPDIDLEVGGSSYTGKRIATKIAKLNGRILRLY
jgi:hypothetical protein